MLIAAQLPEFLWEQAITHVAYIRNHAYLHALGDTTPYQRWYDRKPTISHLREFGVPVWVLLQGQKVQCKMLPKSSRRTYVGYEDGSKSIKYYSAETRKVLTSRNFHFLSNLEPQESTTDDDLVLTPNISCEGENGQEDERNLNKMEEIRDCKRKRKLEDEPSKPRKTRGICRDYRKLHNPYESEEEKSQEYANAMEEGDDYHSLKDAQAAVEWPEWEHTIRTELKQLEDMGTWQLVERPMDVNPISNKWVFTKKRDKSGQIVRYKARLHQ